MVYCKLLLAQILDLLHNCIPPRIDIIIYLAPKLMGIGKMLSLGKFLTNSRSKQPFENLFFVQISQRNSYKPIFLKKNRLKANKSIDT
jgi:hypothetical protein